MLLDDICTSKVYETNPFYVLGLPIDISSRKLRRCQEDLIDGAATIGGVAWNKEFSKRLLGASTPPEVNAVKDMFDRLKDPEFVATEIFFWFWPKSASRDPAVEAVIAGKRDEAVRMWRSDMRRSDMDGLIARHNLAVAFHYYAIDAEKQILNDSSQETPLYVAATDRFWKSSFELWDQLVDDDEFWDCYQEIVARLNDPRLNDVFVEEFRNRLPVAFDNINADFLVAYAESGRMAHAKRHFEYMVSTMAGSDDVEETMECAFKPMVSKVNGLVKACQNLSDPKDGLKAARNLLSGASKLMSILGSLVPDGNAFTNKIAHDIVLAADKSLSDYSRATADYEACLEEIRKVRVFATTPMLEKRVGSAISDWENLVRIQKERSTCCVCGRYQKGMPTKEVKLYRDVRPDLTTPGRIEWRTRTIDFVPVCAACSSRFRYNHASNFSPVKQSIAEGWKLGDKPTEAEMRAVSFF